MRRLVVRFAAALALALCTLVAPLAAVAQQPAKGYRVGHLSAESPRVFEQSFREALREQATARAATSPSRRPMRTATSRIPIVMAFDTDPVGTGFVASLARPGRNATGLTSQSPELDGKRLELLKETLPRLTRVAVVWNPTGGAMVAVEDRARRPARRLAPLIAQRKANE